MSQRHLLSLSVAAGATLLLSLMPPMAQGLGLLALAILCWATGVIGPLYAGVMIPAVALLLGVVSPSLVVAKTVNPVISIFVFGFVFAYLFHRCGLGDWMKVKVLRWSGGRPRLALAGFATLAFFTSMLVTNVASVALFFPLALSLAPYQYGTKATPLQKYIGVLIVLSATMGGISSIIGSTTSLIVAGLTEINMVDWIKLMLPLTLSLWLLGALVARRVFAPEFGERVTRLPDDVALAPSQRWVLLVFSGVLMGWLWCYRQEGELARQLAISLPMLAILPLAWLSGERVPALLGGVQWPAVGIFVSALVLSEVLKHLGVACGLGAGLQPVSEVIPAPLLVLGMLVTIMAFTEFVTNSGTVAIWGPMVLYLVVPLELEMAEVAIILAMGGSTAYILPSSTPGNAVLYSAGVVQRQEMLPLGYRMKLTALLVILLGLVGWAPIWEAIH
ncbi:SLC13 family permease [Ferrimonas balearica]|uniref:SLC13 family permease n=1 Tax=Ferrimonas balearica TaxID=44012 RepID=UPI001F1C3516|nr:SLC13 family permease [Ferrimonas balearica]MBY6093208.1 hypothetical protein [Ferrimonas balearica]